MDKGISEQIKNGIPYSRKIWWGIKFGGLAVYHNNRQLKSAKISYSHIYVWQSRTESQIKIRQYFCNGHLGPNRQT